MGSFEDLQVTMQGGMTKFHIGNWTSAMDLALEARVGR
jgi:hypothetical protein